MARKISETKTSTATKGSFSWAKQQASSEDKRALIAKKAYELFAKRGYQHGNDMADWLEAERLVSRQAR